VRFLRAWFEYSGSIVGCPSQYFAVLVRLVCELCKIVRDGVRIMPRLFEPLEPKDATAVSISSH